MNRHFNPLKLMHGYANALRDIISLVSPYHLMLNADNPETYAYEVSVERLPTTPDNVVFRPDLANPPTDEVGKACWYTHLTITVVNNPRLKYHFYARNVCWDKDIDQHQAATIAASSIFLFASRGNQFNYIGEVNFDKCNTIIKGAEEQPIQKTCREIAENIKVFNEGKAA